MDWIAILLIAKKFNENATISKSLQAKKIIMKIDFDFRNQMQVHFPRKKSLYLLDDVSIYKQSISNVIRTNGSIQKTKQYTTRERIKQRKKKQIRR